MDYRSDSRDTFPMSDMQTAYWMSITDYTQKNNSRIQYYCEYNLTELNLEKFKQSWDKVLERHDMLSAVALNNGQQTIIKYPKEIHYIDIRDLKKDEEINYYISLRNEVSHKKFNCCEGPQYNIYLIEDDEFTKFILHLNMWAIDAYSVNIILSDLARFYFSEENMANISYNYKSYLQDFYSKKEDIVDNEILDYWYSRLGHTSFPPNLPIKTIQNNKGQINNFSQLEKKLSNKDVDILKKRARELNTNIDILLLSIFCEVINYWNDSNKFCINIPTFSRPFYNKEINDIAGEFSSYLILNLDLPTGTAFKDRVNYIHKQYIDDLNFSQVSSNKILRHISQRNNQSSINIYPVVFTLSHGLDKLRDDIKYKLFGDLKYDISHTPNVKLDCRHEFYQGALTIKWDYDKNHYADNCIESMFEIFINLVTAIISDTYEEYIHKENVVDLPIKQKEKRYEINNNRVGYSSNSIFRQFSEMMESSSCQDENALICETKKITYQEMYKQVCVLGGYLSKLINQNKNSKKIIAILLPKSCEQIICVWGILASGCTYLPLDLEQPKSRVFDILEDAKPDLIIINNETENLISQSINIKTFNIEKNKMVIESEYIPLAETLPGYSVSEEDLIYIMYTSGTTGVPKGVMVNNKGVNNAIDYSIKKLINFSERPIVLGVSALHHDMSVFDTLATFIQKGVLILPKENKRKDPEEWSNIIKKYNVNYIVSVPAIIDMLFTWCEFKGYTLDSIKNIIMGGDWIPTNILKRIEKYCSTNVVAYSVGGPTETTMWNITNRIKDEESWLSVPYGYPIQNCSYYILNKQLIEVPDWVIGEMYCGGVSLAQGYMNDPKRTAEKFIIHPITKERLYNTGDLGLYHPDGRIEFIGRKDGQVKIKGVRVECGEVQKKLEEFIEVSRAIVYLYKGSLTAALVLRPNIPKINDNELYQRSKEVLPVSMLPSLWIQLYELPLTKNQKVDYQKLTLITEDYLKSAKGKLKNKDESMKTKQEVMLCEIWEGLLNKKIENKNDSFFSLGGDSLLLISLSTEIFNHFSVQIPFAKLLMNLKIDEQIHLIKELQSETNDKNKIAHIDLSEYPLLPNQEDIWLAEKLSSGKIKFRIVFGLKSNKKLEEHRLKNALEYLRSHHIALSLLFSLTSKGLSQYVDKNKPLPIYYEKVIDESSLISKIREIENSEFDLFNEYAWRVHLIPLSNGKQIYLFNFHHIIFDGWSVKLFFNELENVYNNINKVIKLDINYVDYVYWKKNKLLKEENENIKYWEGVIKDGVHLIEVNNQDKPESMIEESTIPKDISELLNKFCHQKNTTPFIVLFSIFQLTLASIYQKENFFVGISDSGRDHPDTESMLGLFIHNPIFKVSGVSRISLNDMVKKVQEDYSDVIKYPMPSLSKIIKTLGGIGRRNGFNDFCQACFIMQPNYSDELFFGDAKMEKLNIVSNEVRLIYEMSCWQGKSNELTVMLNYDKTKSTSHEAKKLLATYVLNIKKLLVNPDSTTVWIK
ncbi:amino acid adenylation domain-containing protein [Providencia stuartii]|nr:amino acid adenylation domain-containing protein [Providencia stuartii]